MAKAKKTSKPDGVKAYTGFFKQPSKVYIVEFLLMHVMLLGVLISGTGLFSELINQVNSSDRSSFTDIYDIFLVDQTLILISYGIVSTLLFLFLRSRTTKSEAKSKKLVSTQSRRVLIYIFLSIVGLVVLGYLVSFTYSLLVTVLADATKTLGDDAWRVLSKDAFGLLLSGAIGYLALDSLDAKRGAN